MVVVALVPIAALIAARLATGTGAFLALGGVFGLILTVAVTISPRARAIALMGGSLVVFQSPSETAKAGYLALVTLCFLVATAHLLRDSEREPRERGISVVIASGSAMSLYLAASFVIAQSNGYAGTDWLRDVLAYAMVAALPVIGIDLGRRIGARWLIGFLVASGLVATIGFSLDWLGRRGALEGAGRIVLSTTVLILLVFAYVLAAAGTGTRRLIWGSLLVFITSAALLSGTRSFLFLFVLIAVCCVGRKKNFRIPPVSLLLALGVVSGLAAFLLATLGSSLVTDDDYFSGRIDKLDQVLAGDLDQDQSFQERRESYSVGRAAWEESPWLGHGPGRTYATTARGASVYSLDTPWMVPAKLGVIGTALIALHLGVVLITSIRLLPRPSIERTALLAWAAGLAALTPFGPWIEDKGLGPCLMLVVAIAVSTSSATASERDREDATQTRRQTRDADSATPGIGSWGPRGSGN